MTPSLFGLSFEDDCSCQFSAYCPLHIAAWPLLIALQECVAAMKYTTLCGDDPAASDNWHVLNAAIKPADEAIALATRKVTP